MMSHPIPFLAAACRRFCAASALPAARRGFTLIELLVVIAIVGILAGTFAFSMSSAQENARIAKATAEGRELTNAIRLFCLTQTERTSDNPLSALGLSEGTHEGTSTLRQMMTEPSAANGNTVYYRASERSIRRGVLCDPWGHPYRIRVRRFVPRDGQQNDYRLIVPLETRHRPLKTRASGSGS